MNKLENILSIIETLLETHNGAYEVENLKDCSRITEVVKKLSGKNIKIDNVVFETKKYDMFKRLDGNRDLHDEGRRKRLRESISRKQLRIPIITNECGEKIDGQNRSDIIEQDGLPLQFVICEGYGLKECQELNLHGKNWQSEDFIKSYADSGNADYQFYQKALKKYAFAGGVRMMSHLLSGKNSNSSQKSKSGTGNEHSLRNGTFKVAITEEKLDDIMKKFEDVKATLELKCNRKDIWEHQVFKTAMKNILMECDQYNHDRLLHKLQLKECQDKYLKKHFKIVDYYDMVSNIYNNRPRHGEDLIEFKNVLKAKRCKNLHSK